MSSKDPLSSVKTLFTKLKSECKTESTNQMLTNINEVCATIHKNGGQVSIPAIVKILNSSGITITKRTIYNKDKGIHPYPLIINAWIKISNVTDISGKFKDKINPESAIQIITDEEFIKIDDHALRYKISLMSGQIKGLRNQLNTIRSIKEQPLLNASDSLPLLDHQTTSNLAFNVHEIDVLKDFVKTSKSKKTNFDEDDSLVATKAIIRHEVLSQPGLKEIINKIIKSYTLPEN
tara:strand:- start:9332 stop:10036 length:705 start_codon:yes stop_codon:yes gene_type:complete